MAPVSPAIPLSFPCCWPCAHVCLHCLCPAFKGSTENKLSCFPGTAPDSLIHLQPKECPQPSPSVPLWEGASPWCAQPALCDHHRPSPAVKETGIAKAKPALLQEAVLGVNNTASLNLKALGTAWSLLAHQAFSEPSQRGLKWPPSLETQGNRCRLQGELELPGRRKAPANDRSLVKGTGLSTSFISELPVRLVASPFGFKPSICTTLLQCVSKQL